MFDRHFGAGGRPGSIHDGVGLWGFALGASHPPACACRLTPACMHAFPLQLLACCGTQMQAAAAQLAAAHELCN